MKRGLQRLSILLMALISMAPAQAEKCREESNALENIDIDIVHECIVVTDQDNDAGDIVRISRDCALYINGERVRTNRRQTEILHRYYCTACELQHQSYLLGKKAGEVGRRGGRLGVQAVRHLHEFLDSDCSVADLAKDIQQDSAILSEDSQKIAEWGREIDSLVNNLEDTHIELRERIPALEKLYWF